MRNRYYEKIKNERISRIENMNSTIEYNQNQIKRMSADLALEISLESFEAINNRKAELFKETRKMIEVREALEKILENGIKMYE